MHLSYSLYIVLLTGKLVLGVIYELNETEYKRMPPIHQLDEYDICLQEKNGRYCTVHFTAVSEELSELLNLMQEYSKHFRTHYNHTLFHYGICVTQKCNHNLGIETGDLKDALEACLNETFWNQYKLKTRVTKYSCDGVNDNKIPIQTSDIVVGLAISVLVILNAIGSMVDVFSSNSNSMQYLRSFSIKRNWKMLNAAINDPDVWLNKLRSLNGIKSLILFSVMFTHTIFTFVTTSANTHDMEKSYKITFLHIVISGSIIIQVCFLISGFLMMYKFRIYSENNNINIGLLLKALLTRWLRITPSYAVVLGIIATWFRRIGSGPFWETIVMESSNDCRKYWWSHLLFVNNFVYSSQCLLHTWYIAADVQLYIVGVLVCFLAGRNGARRKALVFLYVIGVILPPVITYLLDLDGRFILSPEPNQTGFTSDPTYNEVYIRGYTNIAASALGLMMGDLFYSWQLDKALLGRLKKYQQKYYFLQWLLTAVGFVIILCGRYFYRDAPRETLFIRVLYAALAPPIFTFSCAILILGVLLKLDNTFSKILEWKGWIVTSRLSYCAFIIHLPVIRVMTATKTSLPFMSLPNLVVEFLTISTISFLLAIVLWFMVEGPFLQIARLYGTRKPAQNTNGFHVKEIIGWMEDRKND